MTLIDITDWEKYVDNDIPFNRKCLSEIDLHLYFCLTKITKSKNAVDLIVLVSFSDKKNIS